MAWSCKIPLKDPSESEKMPMADLQERRKLQATLSYKSLKPKVSASGAQVF